MRTDLELLQILKTFLEERGMDGCSGLCIVTCELSAKGLITWDEENRLDEIFRINKPKGLPAGHFWPCFELPPRLKFVNELIEKYTNQID